MNYLLHLTIYFCIYAILAMSLNVMVGYCGKLTLASSGYFAIGAYAYALATVKLGWHFVPAIFLGILIAALASLVLSIAAWRFKGDVFVMFSLAVQAIILGVCVNWAVGSAEFGTWANLTNGPLGISAIANPVHTRGNFAVLALALMGIAAILCRLLLSSPFGRILLAMRDDELALRGLGKGVKMAKVYAFAFSCGLAALAGSLYAAYLGYINPSVAALDFSVLWLCMAIIGGMGNLYGPFAGAAILLLLPEMLRFAQLPTAVADDLRLLLYGVFLILLTFFRPQGICGRYRVD